MDIEKLKRDIEELIPRAEAEKAWEASQGKMGNPFFGVKTQLAARQNALEKEELRAKGAELVESIENYTALNAEVVQELTEEKNITAQLAEMEQHPTIKKWNTAHRAAGFGQHLELYLKWLESGQKFDRNNVWAWPDSSWPPEVVFDGKERALIIQRRDLKQASEIAYHARISAENKRSELLAKLPELAAIDASATT